MIAHWDDIDSERAELGHIAGRWTRLGEATETRRIGVNRVEVDPHRWSTPAHIEIGAEEIFYVLGGSGLSWQQLGAEGEVRTHEIGPGDCIVHRAGRERHTLYAGPDGLDLVAFGTRAPLGAAALPRAGVAWLGGTWVEIGGGEWPWAREVAAGEPERPEPSERPGNIKRADDVEGAFEGRAFFIGQAAGAQLSGLNETRLASGQEGAPPHVHSAEDEFFVVLDGEGTFHLTPTPGREQYGAKPEQHAVRRGHVVSRPAGTGFCHHFVAGDGGLVYLAYGTRQPHDTIYYLRDKAIWLKGLGVMVAAEHVGFGE